MQFELRPWYRSDVQDIAKCANNPKIENNLRNAFPYPYTLDDASQYISVCLDAGEEKQCCRAIVVDGKAAGSIGIFVKDDVYCKSAELGYWLSEAHWGTGIMTAAVEQICAYIFHNDDYDIERIFAEPYADNVGSRRVLEKAGFTLEGILKKSVYKNGKLKDSCIYALLKTQE